MAFYKQLCIHCRILIERDSRFCPGCGSRNPFNYLCPTCLRIIEKGDSICAGCGRPLYLTCPACKGRTFIQEKCECCGVSLMIVCGNPRCKQLQFFENEKCTACGKKIKKK